MKKNHFHNPNKGPRAVHQNRTKFDPNKHFEIKIDPHIMGNKSSLCCWRCSSIIQWKVNYAKYRELERSGKCNVCHQRTVGLPFHRVCQACALERAICAKCQKPAAKLHEQALLAFEKQRYFAEKKRRRLAGEAMDSDSEDGFSSEDSDEDSEMDPEEGGRLVIPLDEDEKKKRGLEGIEIEESDDEFKPLLGLNVGRLKREKRQRQREAEEIDRINMRERDRRTALRQIRKAKEAEAAAGKMDFNSDDSDEEM